MQGLTFTHRPHPEPYKDGTHLRLHSVAALVGLIILKIICITQKSCVPHAYLCRRTPKKDTIMKELQGKYCTDCKIFTDNVEEEAVELIQSLLDQRPFEGAHVRIMPDVHMGKGITIGFSAPLGKYVNPNHVGVDIGCTVSTMELDNVVPEERYAEFESLVGAAIPTGFHINESDMIDKNDFFAFLNAEYKQVMNDFPEMVCPVDTIDETFIKKFLLRIGMDTNVCVKPKDPRELAHLGLASKRTFKNDFVKPDEQSQTCLSNRTDKNTFYRSLPSLGGGNHFLEYGETDDGRGFFTAHCGSRNLGVKVCSYWLRKANEHNRAVSAEENQKIVEAVKASCKDRTQWGRLIAEAVAKLREDSFIPGYLTGGYLKGYLSDMVITQAYARYNHIMIHQKVKHILQEAFGIHTVNEIYTTHNYIDFKDHPMLRKGAIRAYKDELCIIPFNMRDGLAICRGKSNEDWNYTAPHGAGRILSRTAAKQQLKLEDFQNSMKEVYSTTVCTGTIDESPMAYKPMDEIVRLIEPTVDILYFVRPKINIKATDEE